MEKRFVFTRSEGRRAYQKPAMKAGAHLFLSGFLHRTNCRTVVISQYACSNPFNKWVCIKIGKPQRSPRFLFWFPFASKKPKSFRLLSAMFRAFQLAFGFTVIHAVRLANRPATPQRAWSKSGAVCSGPIWLGAVGSRK